MQINEIISRLSAEQPAERQAAHRMLVAGGAEAVGPVLDVLRDELSSVDWSVSAQVLCDIGVPAFEPVRDALAAATGCEVRRRGPAAGRAGRRRLAALTALAEIGGWDALDTADRIAVTRLIAVKAALEVPEPMHLCGSWYALPTTDQAAVLDAFGLTEPTPVTMRMGESAWNHDHHDWSDDRDHSACRRMYVTPVLDSWTLVFGSPHLDQTDEAAARDDMLARCAALSSRFGAAHWYGASCGDEWTAWCVADHGEILRYYDIFEPESQIGESHPAEQGLVLPHEDPFPEDAFDGIDFNDHDAFRTRWEQVKRDLNIPDQAHSTTIAARISVDPASLGPHTVVNGRAVLALTACNSGLPSPRGALRI